MAESFEGELQKRLGFDVRKFLGGGGRADIPRRLNILKIELARQPWISPEKRLKLTPTGGFAILSKEDEELLAKTRDPRTTGEKFVAGFTRPLTERPQHPSFLKEPGKYIAEALGRPVASVAGGLLESGLVSPRTMQETQKLIEATTPAFMGASGPLGKGLSMAQRLQALRSGGGLKALPKLAEDALQKAATAARRPGTLALPPGPQRKALPPAPMASGRGGGTPSAPAGPVTPENITQRPWQVGSRVTATPPRRFAVGPSHADPFEGAKQAGARFIARYAPESQQLPRTATYRRPLAHEGRGGLPTQAEVAGIRGGVGGKKGSPIIVRHAQEPVESGLNRPAGGGMPTAREVGMAEGARATGQTGNVPTPAEVFRGIHPGKALDEIPTQAEVAQARVVDMPERVVEPTTGGAKPVGDNVVRLKVAIDPKTGRSVAVIDQAGNVYSPSQPLHSIPTPTGQQAATPASPPITATGAGGAAMPPRQGGPLPGGQGHINVGPVMNPNTPIHQWPVLSFFDRATRWWKKQLDKLPADPWIAFKNPESKVLTAVEHLAATVQDQTKNMLKRIQKAIYRYSEQQWVDFEHAAVTAYDRAIAAGASEAQAWANAMRGLPTEIQQYFLNRRQVLQAEQAATQYLRASWIPEVPGPYLPRLTEKLPFEQFAIRRGKTTLGSDFQQTVKTFELARRHRTYSDGLGSGVTYLDPRGAILRREYESIKLRATADAVKIMEDGGTLFRTKADADLAAARLRASGVNPKADAVQIKGLPGDAEWWAATDEEGLFLKQNLTHVSSGVGIDVMNRLFRNPNLVNPFPHFTKNMLYKYVLSGGSGASVKDMVEFSLNHFPKLSRALGRTPTNSQLYTVFKQVMPHGEASSTAGEMMANALRRYSVAQWSKRIASYLNKGSGWFTFQWFDPMLRYSLWKKYLKDGLTPQLAANHVAVDLVRYGTRSQLVDFWKSVPFNFFVPWRVGTLTTVAKQFRKPISVHALRAGLFIAAVDLIRDIRYRRTGRWTHLPIDYIEGPIALLLEKRDPRTIGAIGLTTAMFGPGGGFAANQITASMKALSKGDLEIFSKMLWGITQVFDLRNEVSKLKGDAKFSATINLAASLLFLEHKVYYKPHRMAGFTGDWLKSDKIRRMENIVDVLAKRGEMHEKRVEQKDPRQGLWKYLSRRPGIVELLMEGRQPK